MAQMPPNSGAWAGSTVLNADKCPQPEGASGFRSQARSPSADGCAPGFVVPYCKTQLRITHTFAAAGQDTIEVGSFQPLQLLAIIDAATSAGVTIDDLLVNGESLFTKFKSDSGDSVTNGLGAVTDLTAELVRSGLNPLPPTTITDQNNQLSILATGALSDILDIYTYWGNPG